MFDFVFLMEANILGFKMGKGFHFLDIGLWIS